MGRRRGSIEDEEPPTGASPELERLSSRLEHVEALLEQVVSALLDRPREPTGLAGRPTVTVDRRTTARRSARDRRSTGGGEGSGSPLRPGAPGSADQLGAGPVVPPGPGRIGPHPITIGTSDTGDHGIAVAALCLQPFQLFVDGVPITEWRGQRCQDVLLLLLSRHPTPVSRDLLIETFWTGADPTSARRCLHQVIYRLRESIRAVVGDRPVVVHERGAYRISPDVDVWTDDHEFERLVARGNAALRAGDVDRGMADHRAAEALYVEGYLPDRPYDEWCRPRREALQRVYVDMVGRLVDHLVDTYDLVTAVTLCERLVEREPTNEGAYRRLMRCHLAVGRRHLATAAFHRCEAALTELGLEPSGATTRLLAQACAEDPDLGSRSDVVRRERRLSTR